MEATDAYRMTRAGWRLGITLIPSTNDSELLGTDSEQHLRNLAKEVEGHFLVNYLRPSYQVMRKLNDKPSTQRTTVLSAYGQIISAPDDAC